MESVSLSSSDLSKFLAEWPYEPGQISVRLIQGDDGEPRVQLRVDLGVLQMVLDGRPDGQRPLGRESLLEHHESRLDEHEAREGSPEGFTLTPEECRDLREEAVQYYHRYVCLTVLEDFDRVVRDTTRNLRVLDLCARHAEGADDKRVLEQFRPYITMMRTRALASQAVRDNEPKAAVFAIDQGLDALKAHFSRLHSDSHESNDPHDPHDSRDPHDPADAADVSDLAEPPGVGERGAEADEGGEEDAALLTEAFDASPEVQALRAMRDALTPKLPVSQTTELKRRLADAIAKENYELAAILRDELKMLSKDQ
jgi:hypothetical protein